MKKILIPFAVKKYSDDSECIINFVRDSYIQKLTKNNLIPVFVSPLFTQDMINELYSDCDGVLFMGGSDFNPVHYKEEKNIETKPLEPGREEIELYILEKVIKDKKPFLGICRGCQALNIAAGGSLHQHIPDIIKSETHPLGDLKYEDLKDKNRHQINIDRASNAFSILNKSEVYVNSAHHQSVKTLGNKLKSSAYSNEGIIEIIEHIDPDFFCFGIQSHPEAEDKGDLELFFLEFSKAVKEYNHEKISYSININS